MVGHAGPTVREKIKVTRVGDNLCVVPKVRHRFILVRHAGLTLREVIFVKMNKGKKCFCTDEPKMKKSLKSFMMCLDFVDFEMLY